MIEEFLEPGLENPLLIGLGVFGGIIAWFMMTYQGLGIGLKIIGSILTTLVSYFLVARMASA